MSKQKQPLPPGESRKTTDHEEIKQWIEARGGRPAKVPGTGPDGGILRVDYPGVGAKLEPLDWEEFFDKFEKEKLAFLHQDQTKDGEPSRFSKFVQR